MNESNEVREAARTARRKRARARQAALLTGGLVVLLAATLAGYTFLYKDIHPGLHAGGIAIGGMDRAEAAQAIDKTSSGIFSDGTAIELSIYNKTYPVVVGEVTKGMDSHTTAQEAYNYTHTGNPFVRMGHALTALVTRHDIPLTIAVDHKKLVTRLDAISAEALTEPVEPSWKVEGDTLTIDRGAPGVDFDRSTVDAQVTEHITNMDFKPIKVEVTEKAQSAIDLNAIKAKVDTLPKNATVDKADGETVLDAVDGIEMNVQTAQKALDAAGANARTISVPITRTPAKVNAQVLREVLFRDTLGTSKTNFSSSSASRANNVRLASAYINGTILNPGESFSYNDIVGERTTERGFKPAGAYVAGKLVDEVGGGVCQPSSTLYMAVLRSDLKVTERTNHGFTVAYTPLGEDATVSYGSLDFQFKNSTDYPIKLLADSSGGTLRMTIIGTKTSDKTVTTDREIVATYTPETIEQKDPTLPVGTTEVKQRGQTGYKVVTYKVITENGKTTRVKIGTSTYKKKDKIVLVGTKAAAAAPQDSANAAAQTGSAAADAPSDPE